MRTFGRNVSYKCLLLVVLLLPGLLACDKSDGSNIADALEDRLTDALNFEGGEKVAGNPPPENPGEDHPQIAGLDAPSMLTFGESFELRITPDISGSLDISQVAIYVRGAEEHIRVTAAFDPISGLIVLSGSLERQPDLSGGFAISVALLREDGESGESLTWNLNIPDTSGLDGDFDFNYPGFLTCTSSTFSCNDTQMMVFFNSLDHTGTCYNNCESLVDPLVPEDEAYKTCYACCLKENLAGLDRETFVECQACVEFMGRGGEGEVPNPEAARNSAAEAWDDIQDIVDHCDVG